MRVPYFFDLTLWLLFFLLLVFVWLLSEGGVYSQYAADVDSTHDGSLVILCLKHVTKCINRTLWNCQATKS